MRRTHTTRIGKRNTVTIPASMLRSLGLKPGDPVVVEEQDGKINLAGLWAELERVRKEAWPDGPPQYTDEEIVELVRESRIARRQRAVEDDLRIKRGE